MNEFYQLDVNKVYDYVQQELNFFHEDADIECSEIGDGNLNLVFRVKDKKHNKSVIVKQSLPYVRCVGEDWPLSIGRSEIESKLLEIEYKLTNGKVPEVYKFDKVMYSTIMEDLTDYVIMRTGLLEYNQYPKFVDQITDFIVNTLILTSDVVMEHKEKKAYVKEFINPQLCEITEDLVYSEPFFYAKRNNISDYMIPFMEKNVWNDKALILEVTKLKFDFMNNAQALLHGDLHTGSIFINQDNIKVIDPEFAFYGPIAYDIGALIANLIMNYLSTDVRCNDTGLKNKHMAYLLDTIKDVIDVFRDKCMKLWPEVVKDNMVSRSPDFAKYYIDDIFVNTAGVAGCEMIRRTVGLAHVADLDGIEDETRREETRKLNVLLAKEFIMKRNEILEGKDFVNLIKNFCGKK